MSKNYDFDGEKYSNASDHQKEWGEAVIEDLELNGDENILDIGCGDGILTDRIARLVPEGYVLGIDNSEGMIKKAREQERPNLDFEKMDARELDLDLNFDIIFSNAALHWIKDHQNLLANCHNLLNDKGTIRFNFAKKGNCQNFFPVVRQAIALPEFKDHFDNFDWPWFMPTISEYREIINSFDFKDVKLWKENRDRYFPDKESMIGWLEQPSLVPFLDQIPDKNKKEEFKVYVIDNTIDKAIQEDGSCFETFRRINVFAQKEPGNI